MATAVKMVTQLPHVAWGKAADSQLRASGLAVFHGHAVEQNNQRREGADDDGIGKDLEDAKQALPHRLLRIGAGMGDRTCAQTGPVGEEPRATPLHAGEKSFPTTPPVTGHGLEGAGDDGAQHRGHASRLSHHAQRQHHIEQRQRRAPAFRHAPDALDAPSSTSARISAMATPMSHRHSA